MTFRKDGTTYPISDFDLAPGKMIRPEKAAH
jgi:hypothetical protein